jgi:predicted dehydrogenase
MPERGAPVRIGILGAARITPTALIKPARKNDEVVVVAVAARDLSRAQAFAA